MRVLWLTQHQLPAATGQSAMIFGGWLEGLRSALEEYEPGIELGIISSGARRHAPFERGNATYFSLFDPPARGRIGRAARAWREAAASSLETVEEAAAIASRFRPDIVHIHGTEHSLGLAALRLPFASVATLQGIATVYERFVLDGFSCVDVARSVVTRDFVRGTSPLHALLTCGSAPSSSSALSAGSPASWDRLIGIAMC